jgi:uncharacterized membrane protein YczE
LTRQQFSRTITDVSGKFRIVRRVAQLWAGLGLFGASLALMVDAKLGLGPWDVLHQGIGRVLGVQIGWVVVAVSVVVLLAWVPLRQRPGFGTVSNALLVGLAVNATLDVLPAPDPLLARIGYLTAGVILNAAATGLYIGARLGPGPRDGLMTGLARRGHSIRAVRTAIEVGVAVAGFALGGSIGVGTVVYALTIGPLVQVFLPHSAVAAHTSAASPPAWEPKAA